MNEQKLREQIAKDIEAIDFHDIANALFILGVHNDGGQWAAMVKEQAARIARGQK